MHLAFNVSELGEGRELEEDARACFTSRLLDSHSCCCLGCFGCRRGTVCHTGGLLLLVNAPEVQLFWAGFSSTTKKIVLGNGRDGWLECLEMPDYHNKLHLCGARRRG